MTSTSLLLSYHVFPSFADVCISSSTLGGHKETAGESFLCSSMLHLSLTAPPTCLCEQDNRLDVLCCIKQKGLFDPRKGLDFMHSIMTMFANVILNPLVRPGVLLVFGITTTLSMASLFNLQIGLDQNVALPKVPTYSL